MTITLTPEIEQALKEKAREKGTTPETLILEKLRAEFTPTPVNGTLRNGEHVLPFEPQDEWERRLLSIGTDCGVSLSNETISSEGIYE